MSEQRRKQGMFSKLFSRHRRRGSNKDSNSVSDGSTSTDSGETSSERLNLSTTSESSNDGTIEKSTRLTRKKGTTEPKKGSRVGSPAGSTLTTKCIEMVPQENTKSENVFEENSDFSQQHEALALTLLEQHQKQSTLSSKLSFEQKLVIIMQNELRATLKENKQMERKIKGLEREIKEVCDEIKKETEQETPTIYMKLQQRFPDLHKRLISSNNKPQLASFIRVSSDYRDTLKKAERLAKVKYVTVPGDSGMAPLTPSPNSTSNVFKKPPILRKKIVAKRHHPVSSKNTSPEQRSSTGTGTSSTTSSSPRRPLPAQVDMQDFINVDNLSIDNFNDVNRLFMSDNLQNRINMMITRFGRDSNAESDV